MSTLITARSLVNRLRSGMTNLRILDGTLSHGGTIASEEFLSKHIPEAQFFDLEECADKSSPYENMLPKPEHFADYVGSLGVSNHHHVVVYDNSPNNKIFSSPRVWWMFRVFGHNNVSILDGGLPYWEEHGYDVTDVLTPLHALDFKASYHPEMVKSFEDIIANLKTKEFLPVDARSPGRFNGEDPEPRDDLKSGHMPGAVNVFFKSIVNQETGLIKSEMELMDMFNDSGVDLSKPLATTCGSGITACSVALAAHLCGKDVPVYDGSWMEYFLRASPEQVVLGELAEKPADAA